MVNTYGMKMHGLKKAAGETKGLSYYRGDYVQISYDRSDGEILTNYHVSTNSWSEYHDPQIITVCNAREPMTMQQIADEIALAW